MATIVTEQEIIQMLDGRVIRRPVGPDGEDELVVFRDRSKAIRLTIRSGPRRVKAQAATGEGVGL